MHLKQEWSTMKTIIIIASIIGISIAQTLVYNKPYPSTSIPTYPSISYAESNTCGLVVKTGARDYELYKYPEMNLVKSGSLPSTSIMPDSCTVQMSQYVVDSDDGWEMFYSTVGTKRYYKLIDDNNNILLQDSGTAYLITIYGYSVVVGYTMSGGQFVSQKVWKLRTGISTEKALLKRSHLELMSELTNTPNPFNPATMIEFELKKESELTVEIVNGMGQIVDIIPPHKYQAGTVKMPYVNNKLSSGSYILKINSTENETVEKIILIVK
jgi:hypothetical protein